MNRILATRSSPLALWQARTVAAELDATGQGQSELLTVKASADLDTKTPLNRFGRTALFTAEVDAAVLSGRAHAGVHSLKDATTVLEPGLVLAAVLERGPVEDALVTASGATLEELPHGARVATGSARRAAMLRRARPDLVLEPLRGNVATRLARLGKDGIDGLLMARAALERLGLCDVAHRPLSVQTFVPAVCQGIVAIVARAEDRATLEALAAINHRDTMAAAHAERACLRELRGGCSAPVGAFASWEEGKLHLRAVVLDPAGAHCVRAEGRAGAERAEELGMEVAGELVRQGARSLLEGTRP